MPPTGTTSPPLHPVDTGADDRPPWGPGTGGPGPGGHRPGGHRPGGPDPAAPQPTTRISLTIFFVGWMLEVR
ncbi:hypothetical protein E4K10_14500 [Streptomyces sp. T1317-0309]|nr:hypothetical protein E4K10_14500 [Streptomyces sp. T1317-0309]